MPGFNEETCQRCGTCLELCPFLQLSKESAKKEISIMIETRSSQKIMKNCTNCSYCNIVCPTRSDPYELVREIRTKYFHENGTRSLLLMNENIPHNIMKIGLKINTLGKQQDLKNYENPPKNTEMFYVGCGIPYNFPELAKSKLLGSLPMIGGMKYCCGEYIYSHFGKNESKIRGLELNKNFKDLGIKKLVTFCPGCDGMLRGVYPSNIDDFDIETQTIAEYLIEKYHKGKLTIKNKISNRITFQDPCSWRNLDRKIYHGPREFLEILGAEVVEMKHHKENSLCCGAPISFSNRSVATKIAKERIAEAEKANADIIAHICTGCLYTLSKYATKRNINSYYITELAQLATGEKNPLNILDNSKKLNHKVMKTMILNPKIITRKYIIKNGNIIRL